MDNDPVTPEETAVSPQPAPAPHVRVWDVPTRLFHWALVLLVFVSWLSADQGLVKVHLWSGLSLLTLLLFRVAWGVMGSTTSRFKDFIHPPRKVVGYLKTLVVGKPAPYAGHNPAGGLMVAVLIASLLAQAATGLFANDGLHFRGPLAAWVGDDVSTRITDLHEMIFNFVLFLVWCHVVAIGFYLLVKGDNLVKSMFTGRKSHTQVPTDLNIKFTPTYMALLLLVVTAGVAVWILTQGEFP